MSHICFYDLSCTRASCWLIYARLLVCEEACRLRCWLLCWLVLPRWWFGLGLVWWVVSARCALLIVVVVIGLGSVDEAASHIALMHNTRWLETQVSIIDKGSLRSLFGLVFVCCVVAVDWSVNLPTINRRPCTVCVSSTSGGHAGEDLNH